MNDILERAISLSENERYAECANLLKSLLKDEPRDEQALFECGYAYLCLEKNENAIERFGALMELNPAYPGVTDWYEKAIAGIGDHRRVAEIRYGELRVRGVKGKSRLASPAKWTACAESYLAAGMPTQAKAVIQEFLDDAVSASEERPSMTAPYRFLAGLLLAENDLPGALEWSTRAVACRYSIPEDHTQHIRILLANGLNDEAQGHYRYLVNDVFKGLDCFAELQPLKKAVFETCGA